MGHRVPAAPARRAIDNIHVAVSPRRAGWDASYGLWNWLTRDDAAAVALSNGPGAQSGLAFVPTSTSSETASA